MTEKEIESIDERVQPFIDWFSVQAGRVEFSGPQGRTIPSPHNVPYGIRIQSEPADRTSVWLRAEKPWEGMCIGAYVSVIYEKGVYRLWYETLGSEYRNDLDSRLCYAESNDGFSWKKPTLNLRLYKGDRKTNIVFDKDLAGFGYHGGTVFCDPAASSSERYKLIYYGIENDKRQIRGAVSRDGLVWIPLQGPLLDNYMSDTQTVAYYDKYLKAYVGYFRSWTKPKAQIGHPPYARRTRMIARATTHDFQNWPVPQMVLSLGKDYHPSHDLYTNAHTLYPGRDDLHLLFPAQYDREQDSLEVYLATSRNGEHWEYFGERPVVPLGKRGSNQEGAIYAGCGLVPLDKERIALPCCGFSLTHNDGVSEEEGGYSNVSSYSGEYFWATWKRDRFVSIETLEEGGFSLPLLTHQSARLCLNGETQAAGEIRVQLADENDKAIEGYSFDQCDPMRGNFVHSAVTWTGSSDITALRGRPITVQLALRQAKLYAFQFSS